MAEHSFVLAGRLRLVSLVRSITLQLGAADADRRPRAWAGSIACPLAVQAAILAERWWVGPVVAALAWWRLPAAHLTDLGAVIGAGVCGAFWAALGVGLLGLGPEHLLTVGTAWAALPVAVLALGRWLRGRRPGGSGGTA